MYQLNAKAHINANLELIKTNNTLTIFLSQNLISFYIL